LSGCLGCDHWLSSTKQNLIHDLFAVDEPIDCVSDFLNRQWVEDCPTVFGLECIGRFVWNVVQKKRPTSGRHCVGGKSFQISRLDAFIGLSVKTRKENISFPFGGIFDGNGLIHFHIVDNLVRIGAVLDLGCCAKQQHHGYERYTENLFHAYLLFKALLGSIVERAF